MPNPAHIGRRDAALYAFPRWSVGTRKGGRRRQISPANFPPPHRRHSREGGNPKCKE
ncbi:MAG: hypothetical protein HAW59_01340 [Betaproteobacteria bacterium]|nr:hypothetical protein [Betaproteobacteria bacterium]